MSFAQHLMSVLDRRILLVIVSLLAVLWVQAPRLTDEFRVDRDFRSFYWMNKFEDPALFPNDPMRIGQLSYTAVHLFGDKVPLYFYSLGYGLLFYVASFFVAPVFFSNLLPLFLMPITVWYLFEFGKAVSDRNSGLALAIGFILLNLASSSSLSVLTGLQRSFTLPLIIIFIYYLHRQRYFAAAVTVIVSALIYAPVFVLAMATWGFFALKMRWGPQFKLTAAKHELAFMLIAFLVGTLILSPVVLPRFSQAFIGEALGQTNESPVNPAPISYENLWDNPAYLAGGAYPLFYFFPFVGRGGLVEDSEEAVNFLLLLVLSALIYLVLRRRTVEVPQVVRSLLWASFIMFTAAWGAIWLTGSFYFYVPNRYTRTGLFLFLLVFVVFNGRQAITEALALFRRDPRQLVWLIVAVELFIFGLVIFYPSHLSTINSFNMKWLLGPAGLIFAILALATISKPPRLTPEAAKLRPCFASRALIGVTIGLVLLGWGAYTRVTSSVGVVNPPLAERELLAFLETLPQDTTLAGTPCTLDNIPLFAKRAILFSCFYNLEHASIPQALEAYYSDQAYVVADFCRAYDVDYLVVDLNAYSQEFLAQGQIFFEPYNQELLARINDKETFALAQIPDDHKVFQSDSLFVVSCMALADILKA